MKSINYRRILAYAAAFSLMLYHSLYWVNLLNDPDQRTGSDFIGFYNFGRITQEKGIGHIYDIAEQQRIEEQVVGHPVTVIFYTHVPFMAPIAALLVNENYIASFVRWALILLFLNGLNIFFLVNLLDRGHFTRENWLILILGSFFFDPTASGFMNGQDSAIVLLGAVLCLWGMKSQKHFLAGLGLSLTVVRPQIALFLAIPFFFKHRNIFWGFTLGAFILAGFSFWLLKMDGTLKFIESLRYIESTTWVEKHAFDMPTISGLIRRNLNMVDPKVSKSFVWFCYITGIVFFSVWWHRTAKITPAHFGTIAIFAVLLAPYAHYHELTLLLIPIFCILLLLEKRSNVDSYYLAVLPLLVSWLSALGYAGSGMSRFPIMYSVMLILTYVLLNVEKVSTLLRIRTANQPLT